MPKMTTAPADDRTPTMAEIARALGVSRQAVHTLHRRGMPVHSVEAAHAWRKANLDPARRKRGDFDDELRLRALVARADDLMQAAGGALAAGNEAAFEALVPALQQALRDVPEEGRDRVMLSVDAMNRLCAPMIECIDRCKAEDAAAAAEAGTAPPETAGAPGDCEAMGSFWYTLAAGEGISAALRHLQADDEAAPA